MFGHWIVYGFRHKLSYGTWFTELYITRADEDAKAKKARPMKFNVADNNLEI
jgi:hypothetical protein